MPRLATQVRLLLNSSRTLTVASTATHLLCSQSQLTGEASNVAVALARTEAATVQAHTAVALEATAAHPTEGKVQLWATVNMARVPTARAMERMAAATAMGPLPTGEVTVPLTAVNKVI